MAIMNSSGGMSDMTPWLERKYANQEEQTAIQANEAATKANVGAAQAGLYDTQAAVMPAEVASQVGLRGAQAEFERQRAAMHPLDVRSSAGLRGQEARKLGMSNDYGEAVYGKARSGLSSMSSDDLIRKLNAGEKFNKGTANVKNMKTGQTRVTDENGNGHPRVDTVPAMLAEGEAVLNAGAAERMGRDEIRQLNKQGLRDMKMGGMEPVMKKGGRLGPFSGVSSEYRDGTNFARTSPTNDAEYHPTEYTEPRDPEHDAEHMAQPLGAGGQGYSLNCGTAKVMKMSKYADGTSDAGGHGTSDTPVAVNNAGTPGGRGRNIGAKFVGIRGYADGIDHVPAESETELDNFARQRDRNQIDEAVPAGTPVGYEAAGQQASVTPSRDTARLRQAFGLTAQGFANGTADVQAPQPVQSPDTVYAAEGDENILRRGWDAAKGMGGRAMEGLRGLTQAAPVDLGTVGGAPSATAAAPTSAAATDLAAKQAAAVQSARAAMGETPSMAAQGVRGMAAPAMGSAAPVAQAGGRGLAYEAGQATGRALSGLRSAGVGAVPAIGGALAAGQALSEMPSEFYNDPNVPTSEKALQAGRTFARSALPFVGGAVGSGVAPVAGTVGGAALGGALASQIEPKGEALRKWEADRVAESAKAVSPAAQPATPAAKAEQQAAAPQLSLRGLATMGTLMGHQGAASVLRDLTDRETNAVSAAAKAAKLSDVSIFDPATLDEKTGQVKPGAERKDLSEQFNTQYMPMYAKQRAQANPNEKLTPAQLQAEAQLSFNLNRAAEEYALKSGKGFTFTRPILPQRTEYISDLPSLSRIIGRARGENEWKEGIWDKGGIVVTDGHGGNDAQKQVIPIEFLDKSWLNSPDMSLMVKSLIKENAAK